MKDDYRSLQKKIDKLLWETSERKTKKPYQEMQTDNEFKSSVKKMAKLIMDLEKREQENRKNRKEQVNT